jgi:hypothetical protein
MGRKPVGKFAMTPAERQRLYMQRLRDKAAANGKQSGARQIVTDEKAGRQMEAMGFEHRRYAQDQATGAAKRVQPGRAGRAA